MAQVLDYGEDVCRAIRTGGDLGMSQAFTDFAQQKMEQASQVLTNAGLAFVQNAKLAADWIYGSDAIRSTRLAMKRISTFWDEDVIKPLMSLEAIQTAKPIMQRWIMADPVVRGMYQKQLIDGFAGSYFDASPGVVGVEHYDYRRVMNGVVVEDEEGDWQATTWLEELFEEQELSLLDQDDILKTQEVIRAMLKSRKQDPTSAYGADLS